MMVKRYELTKKIHVWVLILIFFNFIQHQGYAMPYMMMVLVFNSSLCRSFWISLTNRYRYSESHIIWKKQRHWCFTAINGYPATCVWHGRCAAHVSLLNLLWVACLKLRIFIFQWKDGDEWLASTSVGDGWAAWLISWYPHLNVWPARLASSRT